MGLFDKKYCDICGEKIGLLGNRKLEDGNLCKDCAKNLSPWFNERRHSTVADIKNQLAYREENKQKVAQFRTTRSIGENQKVLFDENNRWFTVTRSSTPNTNENPDIIDYSDFTGCRLDIDENKTEIYRQTNDGKNEHYNPPRYKYLYTFEIIINVNNPYFDEIRFHLNSGSVYYEPQQTMQVSLFGRSLTNNGANPENCPEYCEYRDMGQEICAEFDRIRGINSGYGQSAQQGFAQGNQGFAQGGQSNQGFAQNAATSSEAAWVCASCGSQNSGKFCESCGNPKPAAKARFCGNCGWKATDAANMPKFCPECGNPLS